MRGEGIKNSKKERTIWLHLEYHIFRISAVNFFNFQRELYPFFWLKIQQNDDECLTQLMREISNLR